MKALFTTLIAVMVTLTLFGQKKQKEDHRDAQIDSLTLVTNNLNLKLDSVLLELVKYHGVYDAIKEKVLHYNFDPTRTSYLIDSLKVSRDSVTAKLFVNPVVTTVKNDSVVIVKEAPVFQLSAADLEKAKAIENLKQLKELLDAKIITEAEFLTLKSKYLNKL